MSDAENNRSIIDSARQELDRVGSDLLYAMDRMSTLKGNLMPMAIDSNNTHLAAMLTLAEEITIALEMNITVVNALGKHLYSFRNDL